MWRFRFGHPATSAPTTTILASAAQVTEAGLTVNRDEWGGNKDAKWVGLTGPVQDNSRVWIDVQKSGVWTTVFSGVMVRRPSLPLGEREALGDKYYRLKWVPVEREDSWPSGAEKGLAAQPGYTGDVGSKDLGRSIRALGEEARLTLPHLVVNTSGVPADIGVQLRREYRGESMAAALDGLLTGKAGWGWTTLPNDRLYVGPPPTRVATLNAATRGVKVEFRDVVTEGLLNAVRWVYLLPDGGLVEYESKDAASVSALGRYSITRYIDKRSAPAVIEDVPATYYEKIADGTEGVRDASESGSYAFLRGGDPRTNVGLILGLRAVLGAPADWVDVEFQVFEGAQTTLTEQNGTTTMSEVFTVTTGYTSFTFNRRRIPLGTGDQIGLSHSDISMSGQTGVYELNPRRLNRTLLDQAAADLYHLPPVHAATASEFGLQDPAGTVTIQRPGRADVTERVVGTRYLIAQPLRTEYLIGESDEPVDARVLSVLVDRKDDVAVDRAVNAGATQ